LSLREFVLSTHAPFVYMFAATSALFTLSLHAALPICDVRAGEVDAHRPAGAGIRAQGLQGVADQFAQQRRCYSRGAAGRTDPRPDRKSTRLNSSHRTTSYAVFCLKKKKNRKTPRHDSH